MNTEQNENDFSPTQSLQVITDIIEKVQNDKMRKLAKKRVGFKISAAVAVLINLMLVLIWYFTTGPQSYFWPLWPLLVWAVSLIIQYFEAYLGTTFFSEDKEYEKLKLQNRNINK